MVLVEREEMDGRGVFWRNRPAKKWPRRLRDTGSEVENRGEAGEKSWKGETCVRKKV